MNTRISKKHRTQLKAAKREVYNDLRAAILRGYVKPATRNTAHGRNIRRIIGNGALHWNGGGWVPVTGKIDLTQDEIDSIGTTPDMTILVTGLVWDPKSEATTSRGILLDVAKLATNEEYAREISELDSAPLVWRFLKDLVA